MNSSSTRKQVGMKGLIAAMAVGLIGMSTLAFGTAALASGGGGNSGGGGKAGGGGGGGSTKSGGATDSGGVLVTLFPQVVDYNGAQPKGSVTLGYAADGSAQSISFDLSAIKVPDGSVLPIQVILGKTETVFTYYALSTVVYTEVDGSITVNHSSATLSLSKLKGNVVPDFPAPSGAGTTEIRILSSDGAVTLLDGITGTFHP